VGSRFANRGWLAGFGNSGWRSGRSGETLGFVIFYK